MPHVAENTRDNRDHNRSAIQRRRYRLVLRPRIAKRQSTDTHIDTHPPAPIPQTVEPVRVSFGLAKFRSLTRGVFYKILFVKGPAISLDLAQHEAGANCTVGPEY